MALRKTTFTNNEYYHIFNRSTHGIPLFRDKNDYRLFLESIKFYLQIKPPTRFSIYRVQRNRFPIDLSDKLVTIIAYCIMPNHFHLIIRQERDQGIKKFIQRISTSYAHYFNLKYKTKGHIFAGNFKAVHIETEEQLFHLSRYIHLNPTTAHLIENPTKYPYSSINIYLGIENSDFVDPSIIMGNTTVIKYRESIFNRKDYQEKLNYIRHQLLEDQSAFYSK